MTTDANQAARPRARAPERLKRRPEFLRVAASGRAVSCGAFKLQAAPRGPDDTEAAPRFGVTVTKKTAAAAVARNRIRRRIKEALRLSAALAAAPGCDYVLVARQRALNEPFGLLIQQISEGLARVNRASDPRRAPKQKNGRSAP